MVSYTYSHVGAFSMYALERTRVHTHKAIEILDFTSDDDDVGSNDQNL